MHTQQLATTWCRAVAAETDPAMGTLAPCTQHAAMAYGLLVAANAPPAVLRAAATLLPSWAVAAVTEFCQA